VVDDSLVFRKVVSEALDGIADVEVIGTASNGKFALARVVERKPDLMTLDVEMPEMDGLEVLKAVRERGLDVGVIVVSALTMRGGALALKALELGAFDFITKPADGSIEANRAAVRAALVPRIKACAQRRELQSILRRRGDKGPSRPPSVPLAPRALTPVVERMRQLAKALKPEMVVIGVSTGGPNALGVMLPRLPADLNVPIFIVQHLPPLFSQVLASSLDARCSIRVKEAVDGEVAGPNVAYIAPGGKQMKVVSADGKKVVRITDDPAENNCKPSVDYLFRSVAHTFPGRATAAIMTGMGGDGTLGLRLIKRHGGVVLAQDEASCVVFGMPKSAIDAGVVDIVTPLDGMADEIRKAVKGTAL
jgi:two-component system chemotaxis response regulator CheB